MDLRIIKVMSSADYIHLNNDTDTTSMTSGNLNSDDNDSLFDP